jgi:Arc/MetJ-type ribon-helix-helix transcriptional regulator
MAATGTASHKRDFATRLSRETLNQLDGLVRQGRFGTRTAAIEAAVQLLFDQEQDALARRRRAFERACGALPIGITRESWRDAKRDRLEHDAGGR